MIIQQTRIQTGGSGGLIDHVLNEAQNEAVAVLQDDFNRLLAREAMGARGNRKYGIRHFVVSPDEALSQDQFDVLMQELSAEFDFEDRSVSVVEHTKTRADGGTAPHLHILVSELNGKNKVMDCRQSFARNEKLSRKLEVLFGHDVQKGRHNRTVQHQLRAEGHNNIADRLEPITEGPPPNSAFSSKQHARAKRLGIDLPKITAEVKFVAELPIKEKAQKLKEIGEKYGVQFQQGDKKSVLTISTQEGQLIGNANKAAAVKGAKAVAELAAAIAAAGQTAKRVPSFAEGLKRVGQRGIEGPDGEPSEPHLPGDEPDHADGRERRASGSGSGRGADDGYDDQHRGDQGGRLEAGRGDKGDQAEPIKDRRAFDSQPRGVRDTATLNMFSKAVSSHGGAAMAAMDAGSPCTETMDPRDPNSYYRVMWAIDAAMKRANRRREQASGYTGSVPPGVEGWLKGIFDEPRRDLVLWHARATNKKEDGHRQMLRQIIRQLHREQSFVVIEEYDQTAQLRM